MIGWKDSDSSLDGLPVDGDVAARSSRCLLSGSSGGEAISDPSEFELPLESLVTAASSAEMRVCTRLTGRLLLTLIPTTCPKALTPLSVLPHFEYSHPSQFGSPGSSSGFGVGNINFALFNAFHSSSSTVGRGVLLLVWNSRPL